MTLSSIEIVAFGKFFLHTTHSGEGIPKLLPAVFDLVAQRYSYVKRHTLNVADVVDVLESLAAFEWVEDPARVASLLIAARPFFLEPLVQGKRPTRADWRLNILNGHWRLLDAEGVLVHDYDYFHEIAIRVNNLNDPEPIPAG